MEKSVLGLILLVSLALVSGICSAQDKSETPKHISRTGIGIKMSTLGAGIEVATRMTSNINLRTGFNVFSYGHPFDTQGITFNGELNLRSGQINLDWFPFHGAFHLSPGLLVYNGNKMTANLSVPTAQVLTLGSDNFRSDPHDPIRGNASITFRKVAPAILFGWGNLIPRKPRHFSIPLEFGVVFHGQPNLVFGLIGKGCDASGHHCASIVNDKDGAKDIASEREKINGDISSFKFYPVISAGFAVNF